MRFVLKEKAKCNKAKSIFLSRNPVSVIAFHLNRKSSSILCVAQQSSRLFFIQDLEKKTRRKP